jgi:Lon protease-like protein
VNADDHSALSLFPLHTVLFPGGPLPLRIFETRYTDMVRRCMREQQPFGVILIQEGDEAGEVATTATVGCSARIADFNILKDGLLGIHCVGERKFQVRRVWRAADGLNLGEVSWLGHEPQLALPEEYRKLLPIELNDKQALLELDDPLARLEALMRLLPRPEARD